MSHTAGVDPEGVRLLLPTSYDVLWSALALAYGALLTWALVLWFRARPDAAVESSICSSCSSFR